MLMPFRMIYELIVFALQFAFVYGLDLMGLFAFFAWLIAGYTPDIPVFIEPILEPRFHLILFMLKCALEVQKSCGGAQNSTETMPKL